MASVIAYSSSHYIKIHITGYEIKMIPKAVQIYDQWVHFHFSGFQL